MRWPVPFPAEMTSGAVSVRRYHPGDAESLFRALDDERAWEHIPRAIPADAASFGESIRSRVADGNRVTFTIRRDGRVVGTTSVLFDLGDPDGAEVGGTQLDPAVWGTGVDPAVKRLLFGVLFGHGAQWVQLRTDERNHRSAAAIGKLGPADLGLVPDHRVRRDGTVRRSRMFRLDAASWFDTGTARIARVYNYWLGGSNHFAADRTAGDATLAAYPGIRQSAQANRAFLARVVRHLAEGEGIRQFLDIGTGLPTADNTHEVAQAAAPASRVVYVDNDPLISAQARALLTSHPQGATAYLEADLRDTGTILAQAAEVLDFGQPVAIMLIAVLHYIPDLAEARAIVTRLLAAAAPGSFLAVSHAGRDLFTGDAAAFEDNLNQHLPGDTHVARPRADVAGLFAGTTLLAPGVVRVSEWRPATPAGAAGPTTLWGGVGRTRLPPGPRRHQGMTPASSKNSPLGPSSGSVASWIAIAAPCSGVRTPRKPFRSVAVKPGQPALMRMPVSRSSLAYCTVTALR
jgi:RimJ/RimL family protein N-acetyltransferase